MNYLTSFQECYYEKIHIKVFAFILFLGLLIGMFTLASTRDRPIAALAGGDSHQQQSLADKFDWNLPTAISAGFDFYQLELLSDDEIRHLHQPYIDIVEVINAELNVNITIGTLDCYDGTREDLIYAVFAKDL